MMRAGLLGAICVALALGSGVALAAASGIPKSIAAAVADPARPAEDRDRDAARHPAELMAFAQVKRTNPPALSTPTGYTHIVEVAGPAKTVYISGQIAYDKDGKVVGAGDMKAQAEQVFKNLQTALTAAGATFSDVVKMKIGRASCRERV